MYLVYTYETGKIFLFTQPDEIKLLTFPISLFGLWNSVVNVTLQEVGDIFYVLRLTCYVTFILDLDAVTNNNTIQNMKHFPKIKVFI